MIRLSDNARNVSTFHESKLLRNPTFSHALRDETFGVKSFTVVALRIVNTHFFSILKMLCKKRIEKNLNFSFSFCNGHFVKGVDTFYSQLRRIESVQSTLSHPITTSVQRATITRFFVEHGLFKY